MFNIKSSLFEKLISGFSSTLPPHAFQILVTDVSEVYTMSRLITLLEIPICTLLCRLHVSTVLKATGSLEEGRALQSGKHTAYGIKVEISVLPNGLTIGCSHYFTG